TRRAEELRLLPAAVPLQGVRAQAHRPGRRQLVRRVPGADRPVALGAGRGPAGRRPFDRQVRQGDAMSLAGACPRCHKPILRAGQKFCAYCGDPLPTETPTASAPPAAEAAPPALSHARPAATRPPRAAWFELGLALAAQGRPREAVDAFER